MALKHTDAAVDAGARGAHGRERAGAEAVRLVTAEFDRRREAGEPFDPDVVGRDASAQVGKSNTTWDRAAGQLKAMIEPTNFLSRMARDINPVSTVMSARYANAVDQAQSALDAAHQSHTPQLVRLDTDLHDRLDNSDSRAVQEAQQAALEQLVDLGRQQAIFNDEARETSRTAIRVALIGVGVAILTLIVTVTVLVLTAQ